MLTDKEIKWGTECSAVGFEYAGRGSRSGYTHVKCVVCGAEAEYQQAHIRSGQVRCKTCHETKMIQECAAQGFEWISKVDGFNSLCRCLTCGHEDTFNQGNMRDGRVKCSRCHEKKMIHECAAQGFEWISKVDRFKSLCRCLTCGHEDTFNQGNMRDGRVKCSQCQITKYQQAAKEGWAFINHCRENGLTYVNLKHSCCDDLVKVNISAYLNGSYDCPHCSHTHFNEVSYFYVIQVEDIVKLGISNRPNQRYAKYGLPKGSMVIEHLRIQLKSKRDALVVESYAKQLVKDFKLSVNDARKVFTASGYTECYDLKSLPLLLGIDCVEF